MQYHDPDEYILLMKQDSCIFRSTNCRSKKVTTDRKHKKIRSSIKSASDWCHMQNCYSTEHAEMQYSIYSVSQKNPPPWIYVTFFPQRLGIFSPNFIRLLYVPIYTGLQTFIQLCATLTKLCHIKSDYHNVLKMSTIDRNARWVVALNMA